MSEFVGWTWWISTATTFVPSRNSEPGVVKVT